MSGLVQPEGQARSAIEQTARLRGEIAAEQIRLRALRSYATDNYSEVDIAQQIAGMQTQLAALESKPSAGHGDSQLSTGQLPETGMAYARSLRDVRYYEAVYEVLGKQFEMAKLDEARDGSIIQVLYPAVEPDKKSFRHAFLSWRSSWRWD